MTRNNLAEMTVDQLVVHFTSIALDQDNAIRNSDYKKYNRLYDQMEAVREELKTRAGDQRQALVPLFDHPNAQVRLKAAITTLEVAPEASRQVFQILSDRNEYPQAADARGWLHHIDGDYRALKQ